MESRSTFVFAFSLQSSWGFLVSVGVDEAETAPPRLVTASQPTELFLFFSFLYYISTNFFFFHES